MKIIGEGKTIETEEIVIKNGKNRVVLSQKSPLYNAKHRVVGVLGISFDITERKTLEKELFESKQLAENANDAKSEFLRNNLHPFRF